MIPGLVLRRASFRPAGADTGYGNTPATGGCPANSAPGAFGACVCNPGYAWSDADQECALTSSGTFGGGSTPSTPTPSGTTPLLPTSNPLVPIVIAAAFLGTIAFVLAETAPKRGAHHAAHRSR